MFSEVAAASIVNQHSANGTGGGPDNGFKSAGTPCGNPADTECTNPDTCNGSGTCLTNDEPAGTPCGDAGTACVNQDTCKGRKSGVEGKSEALGGRRIITKKNECNQPDTCHGSGTWLANDRAA